MVGPARLGAWPRASRNERGTLALNFDTSAKGDAFVYVRSGPVNGSEAHYLPVIGGPPRQLTNFAETWEGVREPQEVSFRSFDGLYIQGFLYLPPNMQQGARYPALVQVHGGGTNSYLRTQNLTRAVPRVERLCRDGDQLSRRVRLRA